MFNLKIIILILSVVLSGHCFGEEKVTLKDKNIKRKVIYDNDLMFDDWFALVYLLKSDVFDIIGITVAGNGEANCQFVEPITTKLLSIANINENIPVRCGATSPLDGYFAFPYDWRKGANTMHGLVPYTDSEYKAKLNEDYNEFEARDFIIKQLEVNEELEIIAVGPLSNVALVIKERPDLIHKISNIWIMGGNVFVPGNIGNNPYPAISHLFNHSAEWNFWTDIEAAKIVFDSEVKISLVPLDATNSVPVSEGFAKVYQEKAKVANSRVGDFISWNYDLPFIKSWLKEDRFYFWDTLAVGIAMSPSMCSKWESLNLTINNQKTDKYFTYTDLIKPSFSYFNFKHEKRRHFHPLIAGTIIEDNNAKKINVCIKGDKNKFYKDFIKQTLK